MSFRGLREVAIQLFAGLRTSYSKHDQPGTYADVATNVDGYSLMGGVAKVPGSTRVSDDHGATVNSLHQFEGYDLDGTLKREQLSTAGGNLYRIESDKSLTSLASATGLPSSGYIPSKAIQNRLYLTGPGYIGKTGGLKYDFTNVRNWGVQAPGTQDTSLLGLDSTAGWATSADAVLSASSTSKDGNGSLQVDKTGTSTDEAYIEHSSLALDLSGAGDDTVYLWLFLPAGALQQLLEAELIIGDSGLSNASHYVTKSGALFPGWNLIAAVLTAPDSTDGSGATLASVDTLRLRLQFTSAAKTQSGFFWDNLFTYDESRPTVAVGAAGAISATVSYVVTFLTETGLESNAGASSDTVSPVSEQVDLSAIPVSNDPQVIARRIYRDLDGDAQYRFVAQIDDNTTTTYTDNTDVLGTDTPPLAGDALFDSSPPGPMRDLVEHQSRVVGISDESPYTLLMSDVNSPEAFRAVDQLQIDEPIVALAKHHVGTLVITFTRILVLTGDGVNTAFSLTVLNSDIGAVSPQGVVETRGYALMAADNAAYYLLDINQPWILSRSVNDQFAALTHPEDVMVVTDRERMRVLWIYPTDNVIFVQQYVPSEITQQDRSLRLAYHVDYLDPRVTKWFKLALPVTPASVTDVTKDSAPATPKVWLGATDGYVYELQSPATKFTWDNALATSPIAATFTSNPFPIATSDVGRASVRYVRADINSANSSTWTCTIDYLRDADGDPVASVSFDIAFPGGDSAPIFPVPEAGVRTPWARITLSNSNSGEDGIISTLTAFVQSRSGFRGPANE